MALNADDKIAELREATRAANETLKDLRAVVKEAKAIRPDVLDLTEKYVEAEISKAQEELTAHLENWHTQIRKHVEDVSARVGQEVIGNIRRLQRLLLGKERVSAKSPLGRLRETGLVPPYDVEEMINGHLATLDRMASSDTFVVCRFADESLNSSELANRVPVSDSMHVETECEHCGALVMYPPDVKVPGHPELKPLPVCPPCAEEQAAKTKSMLMGVKHDGTIYCG